MSISREMRVVCCSRPTQWCGAQTDKQMNRQWFWYVSLLIKMQLTQKLGNKSTTYCRSTTLSIKVSNQFRGNKHNNGILVFGSWSGFWPVLCLLFIKKIRLQASYKPRSSDFIINLIKSHLRLREHHGLFTKLFHQAKWFVFRPEKNSSLGVGREWKSCF